MYKVWDSFCLNLEGRDLGWLLGCYIKDHCSLELNGNMRKGTFYEDESNNFIPRENCFFLESDHLFFQRKLEEHYYAF